MFVPSDRWPSESPEGEWGRASDMTTEYHLVCEECGRRWRARTLATECPECGGELVEADANRLADEEEEELEGWMFVTGFGGFWPPLV